MITLSANKIYNVTALPYGARAQKQTRKCSIPDRNKKRTSSPRKSSDILAHEIKLVFPWIHIFSRRDLSK